MREFKVVGKGITLDVVESSTASTGYVIHVGIWNFGPLRNVCWATAFTTWSALFTWLREQTDLADYPIRLRTE